jgi:hypothetical protein
MRGAPTPTDTAIQTVRVSLEKSRYSVGEKIETTVTNNTSGPIYYYPESCAGRLVNVFSVSADGEKPIIVDEIVCMLAPEVNILPSGGQITGAVTNDLIKRMKPGSYKLQFKFSYEMRDRFALGEIITINSDAFEVTD